MGERAIMLVGSEDSADGSIAFHLFVKPGGGEASEHAHPSVSERFRVLQGTIGLRLDGEDHLLGPGAEVAVPPGVAHRWWNAGANEAQMLIEVDQGRPYELLMCTLFGLGNDRLTNRRGMPRLLQLAVIAREFRDVIRFSGRLRRLSCRLLAPIGQALGYQPWYPRYLRPHGTADADPSLRALLRGGEIRLAQREVVAAA